jgi:Tfp pilus assembly protein PilX
LKRLDERGNVLLYTLIGAIVATVLAVSMAQMLLARSTASAKVTAQTAAQREAEMALSLVYNTWNTSGVCANIPAFTYNGNTYSYTCGSAGTCACTCSLSPACTWPVAPNSNPAACPPNVSANVDGTGRCKVTVTTPP